VGTRTLPHALWFYRRTEDCISCIIVREADAKRQREQRKRDEKEAKKRSGDSFFKQTTGRKNFFKTKR
jgi:hypothetical protein